MRCNAFVCGGGQIMKWWRLIKQFFCVHEWPNHGTTHWVGLTSTLVVRRYTCDRCGLVKDYPIGLNDNKI